MSETWIITIELRGQPTIMWWASVATMSIVTVMTVAGNAAVILALKRLPRAPAHYPLASLAIADLLLGLFVLPLAAARELFVFHFHSVICSCWSTLDVLCCTASILSLCALGWERWCGITAPLARAKRSRRAKIYAILVWPVATAVALPTAFIPSQKNYLPGEIEKACTVNTNVGYVFFSTFFSFYLPASVMVTLYARIVCALASLPTIRSHRGRSPGKDVAPKIHTKPDNATSKCITAKPKTESDISSKLTVFLSPKGGHLDLPGASTDLPKPAQGPNELIPQQRRATRTIVTLMSLFLVCWCPFFIMLPIDSLCHCVWETAWWWCTWLGYLNSTLNPLVYAAASPSVRGAIQASLTSSSLGRTTEVPLSPHSRRP